MLTEEMLASLIDALRGVDRFILVGDPRQLPPIGAGRPFFDIVERLRPDDVEAAFPRRATGYAELTVHRRHKGDEPDDVQLARWFSGQPLRATDDEILGKVEKVSRPTVFDSVEWTTGEELRDLLLSVLVEELPGVSSRDDVAGLSIRSVPSTAGVTATSTAGRPRRHPKPGRSCRPSRASRTVCGISTV